MAGDVRYMDARGLRFAYLEAGAGPLVLFLHGFPDTARGWDATRRSVGEAGYRAVAPWMRGYHPTAVPERDADLETLARDVPALIEALGARDAIVVGHDWGGAAAYGAAALAPDRITRLVVVGTPHPAAIAPTPKMAWAVRHFVAYRLPGAAARFARNDFAALPAIYRRWSPTWTPSSEEFAPVRASFARRASLEAAFGYYRRLGLRPPAVMRAPIRIPTVVFAGLDDPVVTPAHFTAAARMFTGGYDVETMPGGHFMHREHPEIFAKILIDRLGRPAA